MIKQTAANVTAITVVATALFGIFKPHVDNYFEDRFYDALTSPRATEHLQRLDRQEGNRVIYWVQGKMFKIFMNIPEEQRSDFHKGELEILRIELAKHRDEELLPAFRSTSSTTSQ